MSKSVTNEEVEDVLSSIRRLVSEDKRPLAGMPSSAPRAADADRSSAPSKNADAERFVLTPSLRVETAADETPAQSVDEGPLDLGSVAKRTWAESDPDDATQAEPLVLVPDAKPKATNEISDQPADEAQGGALNALVQDTLKNSAQDESVDEPLEDGDYSDESYWEEDAAEAGNDHKLEASDTTDRIEDDHQQVDEPRTRGNEAADDNQTPERKFEVHRPSMAADLTAKLAALETAASSIAQEFEPDGDEEEAFGASAVPAMVWEDDVELDAKGVPVSAPEIEQAAPAEPETAPAQDASDGHNAALAAAFGGDDQLMDEEALRDLVSEIVRAELQGALGERITRNVRKLVRREIHRALTAQELD
ncbi:MAG: hypothetical protein WBG95_05925 [Sulfitobacter sp.]